jgi:non-specific serine/threonine protein kinase
MVSNGTRIGPYLVLGPLGAGGMGEVYLARDDRLGRDVALKMLPAELAGNEDSLTAFRREALTLAALNHPNIATIHGFEESPDGHLALVLERIEGESLKDRIERGSLGLEEAMQVCAQVAEALEVAHERGVIHRDLKPGNVMIGPRGLVKVLDFGLARSVKDVPTEADAGMSGSPGYMSPEQVNGIEQDERTDVFSFGCVLYECLTGRRAFDAESEFELMAMLSFHEPDRALLPARTPSRIRHLVDRCLAKDPEERLREMRVARVDLEEALGIRRAAALRAGEAVATPNNLPQSLTTFVGREEELVKCGERLATSRLLTLTGVGGGGKTRLALKLAEDRLDQFADGVWIVNLAPVTEGERVAETTALAIGLRPEPGRPVLDSLLDQLGPRRSLLVLDNCEHLLPACASLADRLLQSCPELKLVATSREGLGIAGETLHVVPSMNVPSARNGHDPAAIARSESVRLFVERAKLAQPGFELGNDIAGAVAEICRRLDGIPLAIELAAARVRVLAVPEIRNRLDDRFRLLTGGSKTSLPRHQTLRAAIQWSVDQLADPERELLRRLSVFAGGWTLGTATAVCMEGGDEFEVLDLLSRLVDKSLVVVDRRGTETSRYRFLETVRQYSLELLDQSGEGADMRGRHLHYFLARALAAGPHLIGRDQVQWFDELEQELENLLGAFAWCASVEGGVEMGMNLAGSIWRFWSARGYLATGRRVYEEALRRDTAAAPTASRANVLTRAGGLAEEQGDYADARPLIEEALTIYRTLGDRRGEARALGGLQLGALFTEDFADARSYGEQALAIYRELDQKRGVAITLNNLGSVERAAGDLDAACRLYEESLALLREVGDLKYVALALAELGVVTVRLGRLEEARAHMVEGLLISIASGILGDTAYLLEASAELSCSTGEPARAARMLGAAQALRVKVQAPLLPSEQRERDALFARIRAELGEGAAASALAEGRDTPSERAIEQALEGLGGTKPSPTEA